MVEFVITKSKDLDRHELVQFMNNRSEMDEDSIPSSDKIQKYVDTLLDSIIQHNVLAYVNGELSGWLGLTEANPSLMILFEWHPFVLPSENEYHIAQNLLKRAFDFTQNLGISNVRVFVDVNKQKEKKFLALQALYESVQMKKTHVHYCMEHSLTKKDIKTTQTPPTMTITSLIDQNKEELLECYHQIFDNGLDDFINSLNEEERTYWDFFALDKNSEASVVLKHNGMIIGFLGARDYGHCMELGPVGLLQEYRGRGLSKILMNHCFTNLISLKKINGYLEVGERNLPAFNLYSSYGFQTVSKKHGFVNRLL